MKLTIINDFGKLDERVWIKDQPDLEIRVVHSYSNLLSLYAIVNGKTQKIINNKFVIKDLSSAEYQITIKVMLNEKVLKNVQCETLKVVNLDGSNVAVPEIEALNEELQKAKDEFAIEIGKLKLENEKIKDENAKLRNYIQTELGGEEDE